MLLGQLGIDPRREPVVDEGRDEGEVGVLNRELEDERAALRLGLNRRAQEDVERLRGDRNVEAEERPDDASLAHNPSAPVRNERHLAGSLERKLTSTVAEVNGHGRESRECLP